MPRDCGNGKRCALCTFLLNLDGQGNRPICTGPEGWIRNMSHCSPDPPLRLFLSETVLPLQLRCPITHLELEPASPCHLR